MDTSSVHPVWASEPLQHPDRSVFLAGPTPTRSGVPSWRPAAVREFEQAWCGNEKLALWLPEPRHGVRASTYLDHYEWETFALETARVIMFWIPRCLVTMPGLSTNFELGLYLRSGRVVLGCPPDAPAAHKNRFPLHYARRYGIPVTSSLPATVAAALTLLAGQSRHRPPSTRPLVGTPVPAVTSTNSASRT
jgi:hypothetical protein